MSHTACHFESLHDLLVEQLQDIFDAENQLIVALPRLAAAATHPELRKAFSDHQRETEEHIARLRQVFNKLNIPVERKTCKAMQGLIEEANEIFKATGDRNTIDAALIAAAQRIEHYEIAAYGCVRAFARLEDQVEVEDLLNQTIKEEGGADKLLTKIAQGTLFRESINEAAAQKK